MKYLYTRSGEQVIVDDEDYEWLVDKKLYMHSGGYVQYGVGYGKHNRKNVYLHRVLMGSPKGMYVDHINRDPLDNRKENLRVCNALQSQRNSQKPKGAIPYRGVTYDDRKKKFQARIKIDRVHKHVGLFHTAWEAAVAYNIFARIYHGDFAILNEIDESMLSEKSSLNVNEMFLPTSKRFLKNAMP